MSDFELGAHLLGRKHMPEDARDYALEDYLNAYYKAGQDLSADMTLQELVDTGDWKVWHDTYAIWHWVQANLLGTKPTPPTPTPPNGGNSKVWQIGPISNQAKTPHCVGFTGEDWGNCEPINDKWPNPEGNTIYYACKVIDGEPKAEDGSNSRSLCKVLKNMGRLGAYAFTTSPTTMEQYILDHGPVGIGIDWYNDMFNPDAEGYVSPTGGIAGGHEILVAGFVAAGDTIPASMWGSTDFKAPYDTFVVPNHWTDTWADKGVCYIEFSTMQTLMKSGGDCWAGLENPLS